MTISRFVSCRRLLGGLLLLSAGFPVIAQIAPPAAPAQTTTPAVVPTDPSDPFAPSMQSFSTYQCPEWFRDAKFGIWSHWGPDSIPGICNNYANEMYTQGGSSYKWHLEHYGHPSKVGYKDVIESWKAEKLDPDALGG